MRRLVGHITWARRESLCALGATYSFFKSAGPDVFGVLGATQMDFDWVKSLLPLRIADVKGPWHPWLYASDAEGSSDIGHGGIGVVRRRVGPKVVRSIGRVAEPWRYDSEDFLVARTHLSRRGCRAHVPQPDVRHPRCPLSRPRLVREA